MTPYNEILTLHLCGYNNTTIAKMAGCARGTVIDVLKRAKQNNLVYPQECELSDTDIHRILHTPIKRQNEYLGPELGSVLFAIGLPKNSIAKEWGKYVADSESTGRKAYSKSAFQGFIRDMDGKYNLPEYVDGLQITLLKDYTITVSTDDNVTTDTRGVSINKSITLCSMIYKNYALRRKNISNLNFNLSLF